MIRYVTLLLPFAALSCSNAGAAPTETCSCPNPKIELHTTQTANTAEPSVGGMAFCPDQTHDVALGGDCNAGGQATVTATQIILQDATATGGPKAGYSCAFSQPTTNTAMITVSVLCLRNAR